ncbi:hypothetical protein ACIBLA_20530 [Streptomyces sp. NPDC050433]|uniref:hypothetical protein n=1 Tax=unclassified Streptomyces TaxID=2593676 RepID=UPI003413B3AB
METLLSGEVRVEYAQMYVVSGKGDYGYDLHDAFAGQEAGLCGGATPGCLFLVTGRHTGRVGLTVELHEEQPPLLSLWEEAVEVPFRPLARPWLQEWAGGESWELDLEQIDYRVRYSARGMGEARDPESCQSPDPVDHYLLQFWPCPPSPARVVRQTSAHAANWHNWARELPPPPTPEEVAEEERLAELEYERGRVEAETRSWGGRLPSDRLRACGGDVSKMIKLDGLLVHELDEAGPDIQRAVVGLAARRACTVAGLADLDWIAPTLEALDRGRELAPPFDDMAGLREFLFTDERVPPTLVLKPLRGSPAPAANMALRTLLVAASCSDPLRAAVDALYAAARAYGPDRDALFEEVRSLVGGRDSRHV